MWDVLQDLLGFFPRINIMENKRCFKNTRGTILEKKMLKRCNKQIQCMDEEKKPIKEISETIEETVY